MTSETDPLLNSREAGARLGISASAWLMAVNAGYAPRGQLPPGRANGYLWPTSAVDRYGASRPGIAWRRGIRGATKTQRDAARATAAANFGVNGEKGRAALAAKRAAARVGRT